MLHLIGCVAFARARRVFPTVTLTRLYPRGNPLTESMPFTDGNGICWLAYIEGVPPALSQRLWSQTVLPGRHLRFDSATESRVTTSLPAGSPFLADTRLRSLLGEAQLVPLTPTTSSSAESSTTHGYRVIEWATRPGELGRAVGADWSRRWRRSAKLRQALYRRGLELVSAASSTLHVMAEAVLGRSHARR